MQRGFFSLESGIFFPNKFLTLGHKIPRDSPTFCCLSPSSSVIRNRSILIHKNPKVLLPAVGIIHMDFRLRSTVPDFFAKKPGNSEGVGFFVEGPRFHEKKGHTEPWCIMGQMANALLEAEVWSTLPPIIMKVNNCTPGTAVDSCRYFYLSQWRFCYSECLTVDWGEHYRPWWPYPLKRSSGSLEMYKVCISL